MNNANTPEQITEAVRQICYMRGIDPKIKPEPKINKLELRQRIEDAEARISEENGDYELRGVNYTKMTDLSPEKVQAIKKAAKASNFGQFTTK